MIAYILLALLLALAISSILAGPVGWRHSKAPSGAGAMVGAWVFLFILLFPLVWLAALWLPATGPVVGGVYWVGPLLAGLLFAVLLAAAAPPPKRADRQGFTPDTDQVGTVGPASLMIDIFFWVFIVFAVVMLIISYA